MTAALAVEYFPSTPVGRGLSNPDIEQVIHLAGWLPPAVRGLKKSGGLSISTSFIHAGGLFGQARSVQIFYAQDWALDFS